MQKPKRKLAAIVFTDIVSFTKLTADDQSRTSNLLKQQRKILKPIVDSFNGSQAAGFKSIQWNATNDRNEPVSAGLYLYTIQAGEFRQTKKMVLLK